MKLTSGDKNQLRQGYFMAAGLWLFGVTLIVAVMAISYTRND